MRLVYTPSDNFQTPPPPDKLAAARAARELRLYFESPKFAHEVARQTEAYGHAADVAALLASTTRRRLSAGRFPKADRERRPA